MAPLSSDLHPTQLASPPSTGSSRLEIDKNVPAQPVEQSASAPPTSMFFVDLMYSTVFFGFVASGLTIMATDSCVLLATNQSEFTVDALPTRRGRPRRTRDMAEMYACICGEAVESDARTKDSVTAMQCGYNGCETSWVCQQHCPSVQYFGYYCRCVQFHLACFNYSCPPKRWRCENHERSSKRVRTG